jgi:NMD protein affecting ribosome stability and mRNA decay
LKPPQLSYSAAVTSQVFNVTEIVNSSSSTSVSVSVPNFDRNDLVSYQANPKVDQLVTQFMKEVRLSQTQFMDEVRLNLNQQASTQSQQASTQSQQASQIVSLTNQIEELSSNVTIMASDVNSKSDILLAAVQRQPQSFPHGHGASSGND